MRLDAFEITNGQTLKKNLLIYFIIHFPIGTGQGPYTALKFL